VIAVVTVLVEVKLATAVVEATVNGAVPVTTVEVMTPDAEMVVNAPVAGVVAPTVPLMLMEAVPVKLVTVPLLGVPKAYIDCQSSRHTSAKATDTRGHRQASCVCQRAA